MSKAQYAHASGLRKPAGMVAQGPCDPSPSVEEVASSVHRDQCPIVLVATCEHVCVLAGIRARSPLPVACNAQRRCCPLVQ